MCEDQDSSFISDEQRSHGGALMHKLVIIIGKSKAFSFSLLYLECVSVYTGFLYIHKVAIN